MGAPADQIRTLESSTSSRVSLTIRWRISGSATCPMVEAVASDEPQIAPKPAQAPTEAMAMPPFRWPSQSEAAWNSALDMPDFVANCPIRRKSGTIERL